MRVCVDASSHGTLFTAFRNAKDKSLWRPVPENGQLEGWGGTAVQCRAGAESALRAAACTYRWQWELPRALWDRLSGLQVNTPVTVPLLTLTTKCCGVGCASGVPRARGKQMATETLLYCCPTAGGMITSPLVYRGSPKRGGKKWQHNPFRIRVTGGKDQDSLRDSSAWGCLGLKAHFCPLLITSLFVSITLCIRGQRPLCTRRVRGTFCPLLISPEDSEYIEYRHIG